MRSTNAVEATDVLSGAVSRLALRQQNLNVLMPVLMHDVNGSLNGLALSTELLSRLQQRDAADPASAANLLLRTKNELSRLKLALKALENRVLPGVSGQLPARMAPLVATMQEAQAVLMPAVRRGQHELRIALRTDEVLLDLRAEDLFDVVAGLAIVAIEGAPPHAVFDAVVESTPSEAILTIEHAGTPRAVMAVEMHRELLRAAVRHSGGLVEWHQSGAGSRGRLQLPRVPASRS